MTTLYLNKFLAHSPFRLALLLIALVFACFAHSPTAQALSPAPDGGYPGGNTAEGQNALFSLTSGGFNTAIGFFSLRSNVTGQFSTAIGAGTLLASTADENTAIGAAALLNNTTGNQNTADGAFALFSNTTGPFNTANGAFALFSNTTGQTNTANGIIALYSNTEGEANTADGYSSLYFNTTGSHNTAGGYQALLANTTGTHNTAYGAGALLRSTGSANQAFGDGAGIDVTTASNVICVGAAGGNVDNSCFIGNIRGVMTASNDAIPVVIDSDNQLGTFSSSCRFKNDIQPMDKASEAILVLKPVTFHYKSDTKETPQFGLIAEDVAQVDPNLVVRNKAGEIYTVRYDAVNAMLLNEFLKEHRKVENLKNDFQATVAQQQKEIVALTAMVKEQASQIQKVRAQLAAASSSDDGLEASKPVSQLVDNP